MVRVQFFATLCNALCLIDRWQNEKKIVWLHGGVKIFEKAVYIFE